MTAKIVCLGPAEAAVDSTRLGWTEAARVPDRAPAAEIDWDDQMRRHGRRVVISLLARGVSPERAKELSQEAWLRVIQGQRAGRFPEVRLPALVIAQAQFLALDDRRRSEHRYAYETIDETAAEAVLLEARELEHQVAARQKLRRIQAVVERSHPNARRVFSLLYGGRGLGAAEIAAEIGISEQRVRQITCELRARIRREVEGGAHA
jgi:RNA polymerase sigma factor (sigma-70 family)